MKLKQLLEHPNCIPKETDGYEHYIEYDANEYYERLLEALKELSIISSNSGNPRVVKAATRAYNAAVEVVKDDTGFMEKLYE